MRNYKIVPSLLSADFSRLGEQAQAVMDAGADALHFDAMDNHFVPNLTVGPMVCKSLRTYGIEADISVHLMAKPIDNLIVDFAKAGATSIIFHEEAVENILGTLKLIRELGCKAGIAIKPETSWHFLEGMLGQLDIILVMTVPPGFGGQPFMPEMLTKIHAVRQFMRDQTNIQLTVDGGINGDNIAQAAKAGADTFVAGSAIFNSHDYGKAIADLRNKLK